MYPYALAEKAAAGGWLYPKEKTMNV